MTEVWNTSPLALVLGGPSVAVCPDCSLPLVPTMAWTRCEWYCLDCGKPMGFLEQRAIFDPPPDLTERAAEVQVEWDEHAAALLPAGREDFTERFNPERYAAHEQALVWLGQRARTKVG